MIKKIISNSKGSAIVMSLIATIGLTTATLYMFSRSREMSQASIKSMADRDIDLALADIGSILTTPANCNANFVGQPRNGTLTEIRKCNSGTCNPFVAGNTTIVYRTMAKTQTNQRYWTKADLGVGISDHARINEITYSITTNQAAGTPPSAAIVTLNLKIEKKNYSQVDTVTPTNRVVLSTREVRRSFTFTVAAPGASNISGCTRSPTSTVAY